MKKKKTKKQLKKKLKKWKRRYKCLTTIVFGVKTEVPPKAFV